MISGNRALAALAATAALLAAFAGTPHPPRGISGEVDALRVAEWIQQRRNVRIYDVRAETAFNELAIPTAELATLDRLSTLTFAHTDTVVVYGDAGDARAERAWMHLRDRGSAHSYLLRGGIDEWVSTVLSPTLPTHATVAQEAQFTRVAELSRYFGGVPRRDAAPHTTATSQEEQIEAVRRRGCEEP